MEVRLALKAAGFSPVGLNGKRPLSGGWQTMTDLSDEEIRRMPGTNTGALTRNAPTLDVDVTIQEAADYVEDLVEHRYKDRGQILVRFGLRPKRAIPFRTDKPFPKIKIRFKDQLGDEHALEFLGEGQQFAVHGIHPDTKEPWAWADYAPWDIERDDLPEIDEAEARELMDYLAEALVAEFGFERVDGNGAGANGNGHKLDHEIRFGNVHDGELAQTASLLRQGVCVDEVVREILAKAQDLKPEGWIWSREERKVRSQCLSFVAKNPELSNTLPDALRADFEALVQQGIRPRFAFSRSSGSMLSAPARTDAPPPSNLVMRRASEVTPEPIDWAWKNRLALGKHTLIAGEPGLGKSQLHLTIAAAFTRGGWWPNGEGRAPKGRVVILAAEDDAADTIVPRLIAAGADLDMVDIIEAVKLPDGQGQRSFNLQTDLATLGATLEELGDVVAIHIDPVSSYFGKGIDSHKNVDVRHVLEPVGVLAARYNVVLISITHFNKGSGQQSIKALHKIIGSVAFVAAPRVAFAVMEDSEDIDHRLFLSVKCNIGAKAQGLGFRLETALIKDGTIETVRLVWDAEPVNITADEAMAASTQRDTPAMDEVLEFLRGYCWPNGADQKDVRREADAAGFSWITVKRAKAKLGLRSAKGDFKEGWVWLPPEA
jgi:putative DNA primase/helicase